MHGTGSVWFGMSALWVASTVLVVTYLAIMTERMNRAIVALAGACVMVILRVMDQAEAIRGIDWNTIALLVGMMIIVSISRKSGVFEYVAVVAARLPRGHPAGILVMLSVTTAVLSALLDNVTTVLLVAPVTLAICRELEVPIYPYLFAEILASNIGGTATLIGDPPNIIIGTQADISFNQFVIHLTPVIVIVMAVQAVITHLLWGRAMRAKPAAQARIMAMQPNAAITDRTLMRQSVAVMAGVIVAFVLARIIHLEPGTIAISGAALLMLLDNFGHPADHQSQRVTAALNEVEWITIFFFVGLFMVVHGVEVAGLLKILADALLALTGGDLTVTTLSILWASAFLSAIIDNIPFVATMIPLIKDMAPAFGGPEGLMPLWWALSLGACLGGNGTLVGASANLTVAGIAERNGVPFRFLTFTKYAMPMMIVHVAICHVYVWLRYL